MYTQARQRDPQSVVSRFYSARSQTNSFAGADIESFQQLNSLSDSYALGNEKLRYLQDNFRRIKGRDPMPAVMRYKGLYPGMEREYDRLYNANSERFTADDFKQLGETIFKAAKGLAGANWDSLDKVSQLVKQDAMGSSRFSFDGFGDVSGLVQGDISSQGGNHLDGLRQMRNGALQRDIGSIDDDARYMNARNRLQVDYSDIPQSDLDGGLDISSLCYNMNYDAGHNNSA